jgi:peptidylprolyl isomerase
VSLTTLFSKEALQLLVESHHRGALSGQAFVRSLGQIKTGDSFELLKPFLRSEAPTIQRMTLESIQNHLSAERAGEVREILVQSLLSDDMAVITTAAIGLADSLVRDSSSEGTLIAALARLHTPDDTEPIVAIVQTLAKMKSQRAVPSLVTLHKDSDLTIAGEASRALKEITGITYDVPLRVGPVHVDHDWETIELIAKNPRFEVSTTIGIFVVEMLPAEAPFTCLSFFRLIDQGFYDGLTFHRVVPNFVVQGGDPRGDGWGGPGYSIRSEFGYEQYDRGMVGVASAGKDTEGCQWFVTHSRQPHLDSRYTIFGRVVSGMDVVDRVQVGETIVQIRMLEDE